jgi:hypothetical protein
MIEADSEEKRTGGKPVSAPCVLAAADGGCVGRRRRRCSIKAGDRTGGVEEGEGHGVMDNDEASLSSLLLAAAAPAMRVYFREANMFEECERPVEDR